MVAVHTCTLRELVFRTSDDCAQARFAKGLAGARLYGYVFERSLSILLDIHPVLGASRRCLGRGWVLVLVLGGESMSHELLVGLYLLY